MPTRSRKKATPKKVLRNLVRARKNARQGAQLATAAGRVIASRTMKVAAGIANPAQMDHAELARMVPEKVGAFYASGAALAEHASRTATQLGTIAAEEWAALGRNFLTIANSRSPLKFAAANNASCVAALQRATSASVALAAAMLAAQHAVTAPIWDVVKANASRLRR